jgi:hypothetical protein
MILLPGAGSQDACLTVGGTAFMTPSIAQVESSGTPKRPTPETESRAQVLPAFRTFVTVAREVARESKQSARLTGEARETSEPFRRRGDGGGRTL